MKDEIKTKFKELKKLIGKTPMVEISYIYKNKLCKVAAKLESYNLTGSIKDRAAFEMLKTAYKKGLLKEGQTICETTSGNMGISLAAIARVLGNPVVICMPKNMSIERQKLIKFFGAKLELCESFEEAFKKAEEYKDKGAFLTYQFENESNSTAHYKTTSKEIFFKKKDFSCFVSGVGTGGTLMGVGKFIKEKTDAKVIAIDPAESELLVTGKSKGKHKIQGLSDDIIPKLYDKSFVDKIILINSNDALAMTRKLSNELGLAVGISSGANFLGCVLSGHKSSVTIFADDNKKYLSTNLTEEQTSKLVDSINLLTYKVL